MRETCAKPGDLTTTFLLRHRVQCLSIYNAKKNSYWPTLFWVTLVSAYCQKVVWKFFFKFSYDTCPWIAFVWSYFGKFVMFLGSSVGHTICTDYIVFRGSNIYCGLMTTTLHLHHQSRVCVKTGNAMCHTDLLFLTCAEGRGWRGCVWSESRKVSRGGQHPSVLLKNGGKTTKTVLTETC